VFVAQAHHPLPDARRLVVGDDGDDAHRRPVSRSGVFELSEEAPGRLAHRLAPARVAVVVRELVDPL
jgi:hypothetical protein